MKYIVDFLTIYFSSWQNRIFWIMVIIFCLYESIKTTYKKRNYIKLWLREHNIGKKYK